MKRMALFVNTYIMSIEKAFCTPRTNFNHSHKIHFFKFFANEIRSGCSILFDENIEEHSLFTGTLIACFYLYK